MKVQLFAASIFLLPVLASAQGGKLLDIKIPEESAPAVSTAPAAAKPAKEAAEIKVIKPSAPKAPEAPKAAAAPKAPAVPKAPASAAKPAPAAKAAAAPAAPKAAAPAPAAPAAAKPAAKPAAAAARTGALPAGFRPGTIRVQPKEERAYGGFKVLKIHQIEKGDTLWDLAGKYYKDPFMWGRIYNANFSSVANPDRIYPRDELVIPDIAELLVPYRQPAAAQTPAETLLAEEGYSGDEESYSPPVQAARKKAALPELGEVLKDFDRFALSEEMPEHQKEWSEAMKVVQDSWTEDGVITAKLKNDDDFLSEGLSGEGEILEISLRSGAAVRAGDYLAVYMRGAEAVGPDGARLGRELQPAGMAEVLSVDGGTAKARVIDAVTGIAKGYLVKKK